MAALRPGTTESGCAADQGSAAVRWRPLWGAAGALALVLLLGLSGGFLWFVRALPDQPRPLDGKADGIVVLTGGTSRIADGLELLSAGRGKRLLISGVNRSTTQREIARLVPQYEDLVACCVDLDYSALNTLGNAAETRRWAKDRNFHSLIVVTSSYHIPRSMAELSHQLKDVRLIPFPVVTDRMRAESWWSSTATAKLLISEYLKYMLAQVRMRLEPALGSDHASQARGRVRS